MSINSFCKAFLIPRLCHIESLIDASKLITGMTMQCIFNLKLNFFMQKSDMKTDANATITLHQ